MNHGEVGLFAQYLDGSSVNLLIAFVAGFITFFASCLLPLIPTYLGYLSGVALNSDEAGQQRWRIFRVALFFVIGFITTFVILGLTLNQLAARVAVVRLVIEKLAGVLFIVLGFFMLGVFKHRWFMQERRLEVHGWFQKNQTTHALATGVGFGFAWTPCIGPVLAVILFWAAQSDSMLRAVLLLISYGVGLGIPFLLVALGFEKIVPFLKKHARVTSYISYASGAFIILAGILMILGEFQRLSLLLLQFFDLNTLAV
ncbi:MAG: hypothetical protein COU69_02290 [Candidatus Pacebacteria bacterium CG10_big_fil_rev_8_21_14_0_10_56_10]|nr:MAG: hypothetical protein COU69_02290 [Candidatus Pacebacteria bacterium CG10_big_fil_rev_8_21_14_0_10_56_10]